MHQEWFITMHLGINSDIKNDAKKLFTKRLKQVCQNNLGRKKIELITRWLKGLSTAHLDQILNEYGFQKRFSKQKLHQDFKSVNEIYLWHALTFELLSQPGISVKADTITILYQNHAEQLENIWRRMLRQLINTL